MECRWVWRGGFFEVATRKGTGRESGRVFQRLGGRGGELGQGCWLSTCCELFTKSQLDALTGAGRRAGVPSSNLSSLACWAEYAGERE